MDLRFLNRVCFTICFVCIIVGTLLGLMMIWGEGSFSSVFLWKAWPTVGILFLASALTLSVSKTFAGKGRGT